jgi:TRAP-type C4-dicarboxylate transport system permease small subunit
MTAKRTIVVVGSALLALLFVSYFAVMLIATFAGDGAAPVKLTPGGRSGSQFPVAALPLLIGLVVVGFFYVRRLIRRRASTNRLTSRSRRTP